MNTLLRLSSESNPYVNFNSVPDGPVFPEMIGATWSIVGGKLINTPTPGTNIIANGSFDNFTGWTNSSTGSGCSASVSGGVLVLAGGPSGLPKARTTMTTVNGVRYCLAFTSGAGQVRVLVGTSAGGSTLLNLTTSAPSGAGVKAVCFTATGTTTHLEFNTTTNVSSTVDNLVCYPINLAESISSLWYGNCKSIRVGITESSRCSFGIAMCIDNPVNPQNYVTACHAWSGGVYSIEVRKVVAGVVSASLLSVTTWTGNSISPFYELRRHGYDNFGLAPEGRRPLAYTMATITDEAILNGAYHGFFSVHPSAQMEYARAEF